MALYDVDKNTDGRESPSPNTLDQISDDARMAHNTVSTTYVPSQSQPSTRIVMKNNMILTYDDQGLVSSVYGYIASLGSTPVFIIAQQGFDVFVDILGLTAP